ncbi:unnamed protein product [Ectocarpus sp. 4 AP-2014]
MLNRKITLSFTCNVCDGHNTHQVRERDRERQREKIEQRKKT